MSRSALILIAVAGVGLFVLLRRGASAPASDDAGQGDGADAFTVQGLLAAPVAAVRSVVAGIAQPGIPASVLADFLANPLAEPRVSNEFTDPTIYQVSVQGMSRGGGVNRQLPDPSAGWLQ